MMVVVMIFSVIIIAVVIVQSLGAFGLSTGYWLSSFSSRWPEIIAFVIFLIVIIAVIASSRPTKDKPEVKNIFANALRSASQ